MRGSKIMLATITGALALFLFDGAFQNIPGFGVKAVERLDLSDSTFQKFPGLADEMAYVATEETVSFVATRAATYYSLPRFFAIEFISALFVSLTFALIFARIGIPGLADRLLLTLAFSLIAGFAIHIPYFNWWGFSLPYTLGVTSKTILGWLLVAFLQNRLFYQIQ